MTISSSAVLVLAVVAAGLAVVRLVEARGVLVGEQPLRVSDKGPRAVLAFAAHYFFSVFVLGTTCLATEASVFLDGAGGPVARQARLLCFGAMVVLTVVFFI